MVKGDTGEPRAAGSMPCKSQMRTDVVQLRPGLAAEAQRLPLRPRFRLLPQAGQRACPTWGARSQAAGREPQETGGRRWL